MSEIIKVNELKTNQWRDSFTNKKSPEFDYDADLDIMYLYFAPIEKKERIITHNIDRYVSFLFKQSDNEIVGMSFEAFKKSFLPSYAGKTWNLIETGIEFEHIKDIRFIVTKIETESLEKKAPLPKPIEKRIQLEPVFA